MSTSSTRRLNSIITLAVAATLARTKYHTLSPSAHVKALQQRAPCHAEQWRQSAIQEMTSPLQGLANMAIIMWTWASYHPQTLLEQNFTAHMTLMKATNAFGLGTICYKFLKSVKYTVTTDHTVTLSLYCLRCPKKSVTTSVYMNLIIKLILRHT